MWKNGGTEGLVAEGLRPSLGESMKLAPPAERAGSDLVHGEGRSAAVSALRRSLA